MEKKTRWLRRAVNATLSFSTCYVQCYDAFDVWSQLAGISTVPVFSINIFKLKSRQAGETDGKRKLNNIVQINSKTDADKKHKRVRG